MEEPPAISPIKLKEWETKQPKYNTVPKIPFRSIILGPPSGSGKTILLLRERWGVSWFVEDKADEEKTYNNKLPPACWLTSSAQLVERVGDTALYGIPPCNEMPLR